eukprot:TRINITY_DN2265_c2_g1_i1.p1 TRINITY_DN2265_c2_g1~~TRINITY_DN2265_c2_g1_i1.p1  ORF type:complete len:1695 (+),score=310.16 TRINITY_DN2265_c2_g1_i1:68-5086(+)
MEPLLIENNEAIGAEGRSLSRPGCGQNAGGASTPCIPAAAGAPWSAARFLHRREVGPDSESRPAGPIRVYVRHAPLRRPMAVDVEPDQTIAELRARVGAEALYLPPRGVAANSASGGGGAAGSGGGGGASSSTALPPRLTPRPPPGGLGEPLDDLALVATLLSPHVTLMASARPAPRTWAVRPPVSQSRRVPGDRAPGGEWHLTKNPAPLVTSVPGPASSAKSVSKLDASKGASSRSSELDDPRAASRLQIAKYNPAPGDASSVGTEGAGAEAEGAFEPLKAAELLGQDWEELSHCEDVNCLTRSSSGAMSLAGELMRQALIDTTEEEAAVDHEQAGAGSGGPTVRRGTLRPERRSTLPEPKYRPPPLLRNHPHVAVSERQAIFSPRALLGAAEDPASFVFAWGDNAAGQCLVGETDEAIWAPKLAPVRQTGLASLCCGNRSSFLITRRGTLWAGGRNAGDISEVLDKGPIRTASYVDLAELENFDFKAAAAGRAHVLAVSESGVLLAWASTNTDGQAGAGVDMARAGPVNPRTPVWPSQVRCTPRVASVACGEAHSLVLTEGGELYSFGSNARGQLGIGNGGLHEKSPTPVPLAGKARGAPMRGIAAGRSHSMALTVSGNVLSWGENVNGQLGLGLGWTDIPLVSLPALVPCLPGPGRHIAAGGSHSAVIVRRGRLFLAGSNRSGQLGRPREEARCIREFTELSPVHNIFARTVVLGEDHTVLLTYNGELFAFGKNTSGQCGVGREAAAASATGYVERPTKIKLPVMPERETDGLAMTIWALAAGCDHTVVLGCYAPTDESGCSQCSSPSSPRRRSAEGKASNVGFAATAAPPAGAAVAALTTAAVAEASASTPAKPPRKPSYVFFRPIAQPGYASRAFTAITVADLMARFTDACSGDSPLLAQAELKSTLTTVLSRPAMLNASFCYPGVRRARLDSAGLCRALAAICTRFEALGPALLDAVAEGLRVLSDGPTEDLVHRDQLRAVAVYMCLPAHRKAQATSTGGRNARPVLGSIAHLVMTLSGSGRTTLRNIIAEECGDARVLRDFLVPNARKLADDAIRTAGQQPWLSGPLWEVVAQLQLQRPLWESVLLLQVLFNASEVAAWLLRPDAVNLPRSCPSSSSSGSSVASSVDSADSIVLAHARTAAAAGGAGGGRGGTGSSSAGRLSSMTFPPLHRQRPPAAANLLDPTAFQLGSLAEGFIPPEVEFWLFQEHAQFQQISPLEVVDEHSWSDAAGMLPRRFCSFMAHANVVPIAFKQRVLQVENVLRQRLSQEQVLWPQGDMPLASGRADPAAFYFMLTVSRQDILRDTFAQMYSASPVDLRRPLRVSFAGEEAVDEGGVMREFFRLLSRELFAPDAGLFFEVEESRRLWFTPSLNPGRQLEDYWMVGVIVALAVYNNHPGLDAPLPSALFKKLKQQATTQEDLAQLFPSHARSLEAILSWTPSQPTDTPAGMLAADKEFEEAFCLSYVLSPPAPEGGGSSNASAAPAETPLCDGGAERPVLYGDREDFAAMAHRYLLHSSVLPQFESFARGFQRVCNSPLFDVLSPHELEAIVAGDKDLDFSHLRLGVQYEGFSPTEQYVEDLWTVLEGFDVQRRRRFLAFCTGSDVAPAGGLQDLHLLVQRHGEEPTMRLPVAHTCFSLLLLPRYSSIEKLRTMLVTAIEWTEGFGLQ